MIKKMSKTELQRIATQLAINCGNPLDDDIAITINANSSYQEIYQKRWARIIRILEIHRCHIHAY